MLSKSPGMRAHWGRLLIVSGLTGCAAPPQTLQQLSEIHEVSRPRWSRQGDLAYLSDQSGRQTAHVRRADGSQLSSSLANVTLAAWNPSQDLLALQYDPDGSENFQVAGWAPATSELQPLAVKPGTIHHFGTFSRRGRLAYSSNQRNPADFDIYLDDQKTAKGSGLCVPSRFVPEGKSLLVTSQGATLSQQLWEVDLKGHSRNRVTNFPGENLYLSPSYQSRSRLWMLSNLGSDFLGLVEWQRDSQRFLPLWRAAADIEAWDYDRKSRTLAFSVNQQAYSHLQIQIRGQKQPLQVGELPAGVYSQLDFRPDGSLTLQVDGPAQPSSFWRVWPGTSRTELVLGERLPGKALSLPQPVRLQSADGVALGGLLSWPDRPKAGLVLLHGGPASQARPTFSPLLLEMSRLGIAVLQLDVRGSTGYGRRFAQLDDGPGRFRAIDDVEAGAAYLRSRGLQKLALMGTSYGGYLSWLHAEKHPENWSALVVGSAISDLPAYMRDTAPWRLENRRAEYGDSTEPAYSPIHQVQRLHMPVFLYHGGNDTRVPLAQAQTMERALRSQGTPLRWHEFPDEGHHFLTPANRRRLTLEVASFLKENLLR
jgi:dipeptidyl aminopeptidase/acylaminoacyl peptidase